MFALSQEHGHGVETIQPLSKQDLEDFLLKPDIAEMATLDSTGTPYISPVWYEWDGKSFYRSGIGGCYEKTLTGFRWLKEWA